MHSFYTMGEERQFSLEALFKEITDVKNMQRETLASDKLVNEKLDAIQNTVQPMIQVVDKHTRDIKYLDHEKRRRNLIIFGLVQGENESYNHLEHKIVHLITRTLELSTFSLSELDFCRRIKSRTTSPRPVILGFTTQRRKIEILKCTGKLKGTNIYVHEDLSSEDREKEKNLRVNMKELRKEGKFAIVRSGRLISYDNPRPQSSAPPPGTQNKRAHSESPNDAPTQHKRLNFNNSNVTASPDLMEHESHSEDRGLDVMNAEDTRMHFNQYCPPSYPGLTQVNPPSTPSLSGVNKTLTQASINQYFQDNGTGSKN